MFYPPTEPFGRGMFIYCENLRTEEQESVFERQKKIGSVAKRCGHSLYTILNILAFDFSVLFVGYSLIGNISLTFFVAQRTKRPARE